MDNRIYAIRYAHNAERLAKENFYAADLHDGPMPLDYFMWVVVNGETATVVDAGLTDEVAARRGHTLVCDPLEVLAALGVGVREVRDVVLTHLHYDHVGHLRSFPNARFWLQDREMAFWTGRHVSRGAIGVMVEPEDVCELVRLNYDGRVKFVDGDGVLAPGITLHRVGGHSPGLQAVRVETPTGPVVLASDASHYYANIEQDEPFSILNSLPEMYDAFDRLNALAGVTENVVPGHDPRVMERYEAVSPDLEAFAVEIVGRPIS